MSNHEGLLDWSRGKLERMELRFLKAILSIHRPYVLVMYVPPSSLYRQSALLPYKSRSVSRHKLNLHL